MREIRLSDRYDFVAVVSEEDYAFLIKWRWTFKRSSRKHNELIYACRNTWVGSRTDGSRRQVKIMMHNVVMERRGEPRPSALHTVHHMNHKSLDNRRDNLEWASKSRQSSEGWKNRKKKC